MAESFSRWESDPLFSAAEVVQDSADRMESVYRTLLHEQSLAQEDPTDPKLLNSLQYHMRVLTTSLETTRWQLEDFEREVNLAALSDESKSREMAILKHKQFIRAIREQILQVERSVHDSSKGDRGRNPQWMNLNEQDKDMLTSFLSGGSFVDSSSNYDSENSIMRRFLDSNTDNDEIIELKSEEAEISQMNDIENADDVYDSSRNYKTWKNRPVVFHDSGAQQELENPGVDDLEFGSLGAKCYSYPNRIRGSAWGFLRNFWLANNGKGSFTKMRKDGEITDLMENAEQMAMTSSAQKGTILAYARSPMQFFKRINLNKRRFQTSRNLISSNRLPLKLSAILIILIILGFLMFRMF